MTFRRTAPHAVQRGLVLTFVVAYLLTLMTSGALAASGTDGSVVDYSQCANNSPGSTQVTANPKDCVPKGWIFGILNPNNSQYGEDQVTAQRLMLSLPAGGPVVGRTIELKWLVRKGVHHAYDSLATWNYTQADADPCQSLNSPTTTTCNSILADKSVLPIPGDSSVVTPDGSANGGVTSAHQLAGQQLEMYGLGTSVGIDSMVYGSLVDESGDLFQSATITYHVASLAANRTVMLLFGGHLAAGGGARSWGAGNGASDISGGPYHIKLIKVDGSSIGNRDNQIMSSAILPLTVVVTTTLHQTDVNGDDVGPNNGSSITVNLPSDGSGVYVKDVAASSDSGATGTVAFKYYPSLADCTADTNPVTAGSGIALVGGSASSTVKQFTSTGTFYWRAFLTGSGITQSTNSACGGEILTVRQNTATSTTLHETDSLGADVTPANNNSSISVTIGAYVTDVANVTPSGATGSVAFKYYPSLADCQADSNGVSAGGGAVSNGSSTSSPVQFNSSGTFYWQAVFTATGLNNSSSSACGDEILTVNKGNPSLTTVPILIPFDSASLANLISGGTTVGSADGSVTFSLYKDADLEGDCDASELVFQYKDSAAPFATVNDGSPDAGTVNGYTITADGTYLWLVVYAGDSKNNSKTLACGDEKVVVNVTPDPA